MFLIPSNRYLINPLPSPKITLSDIVVVNGAPGVNELFSLPPIMVLLLPIVIVLPLFEPSIVFQLPDVISYAVFTPPKIVLKLPLRLLCRAAYPIATFCSPTLLKYSA